MSPLLLGLILAVAIMLLSRPAAASRPTAKPPAIVLAAFGTSDPQALEAITHIADRVRFAYPERTVRLAFTSSFIRKIWRRRADEAGFRRDHPEVPEEIYHIANTLSELAALQEEGPRSVVVQSLHVTDGAEYRDLAATVRQLAGIITVKPEMRPFPRLVLGPPALGDGSEKYLERAARALSPLAEAARDQGAALILMGHGNEHLSQRVYGDLRTSLRRLYGPSMHVGLVEGSPSLEEVMAELEPRAGRLLLAPLMVVAGDHAKNDLAGEGDDSWASRLKKAGYQVQSHLRGLGSLDSWADIYLENLREAENGLE